MLFMLSKSHNLILTLLIAGAGVLALLSMLPFGLSAQSNQQKQAHSQHMHDFSQDELIYEAEAEMLHTMAAPQIQEEADYSHLGPNATIQIAISNFVYSPAVITVTKGSTLVWTNKDLAPHTVTPSSGDDFDSGFMGQGSIYSLTVTDTSSINYFCAYHFGMIGKVNVVDAPNLPPSPTPTPTASLAVAPCYAAKGTFSYDPSVPITTVSTANASGKSLFLIDTRNNLVSYRISYTQVTTIEQRSHIHEFIPSNVTAPARYTLPKGNSKVGVWQYDESHQSGLLAGQMHVNIHNANFPNGEIRAQMNSLVPCKRVFTPIVRR